MSKQYCSACGAKLIIKKERLGVYVMTQPEETIDRIEFTLELVHDYKAGDKIVLEIGRFPELKAQLNSLIEGIIGEDDGIPAIPPDGNVMASEEYLKAYSFLRWQQRKRLKQLGGSDV